jgi:hypothetical protein
MLPNHSQYISAVVTILLLQHGMLAAADETAAHLEATAASRRFHAEYFDAAAALQSRCTSIHGTGRHRGRNVDWVEVEFFLGPEGEIRFHRSFMGPRTKQIERDVGLITPTVSASGKGTKDRLYREYVGKEASDNLTMRTVMSLSRYTSAAYCFEGTPLTDLLRQKKWQVTSVTPYDEDGRWIRLACNYTTDLRGKPETAAKGEAEVILSPDEGWAIRRLNFRTGSPYNVLAMTEVDYHPETSRGTPIPSRVKMQVYDGPHLSLAAKPKAGTPTRELNEFELLSIDSYRPSRSDFTLSAVGLDRSQRGGDWTTITVVATAGLFAAVATAIVFRNSLRRMPRRYGNEGADAHAHDPDGRSKG